MTNHDTKTKIIFQTSSNWLSPRSSFNFILFNTFSRNTCKVLGLAPVPDFTYFPVSARGVLFVLPFTSDRSPEPDSVVPSNWSNEAGKTCRCRNRNYFLHVYGLLCLYVCMKVSFRYKRRLEASWCYFWVNGRILWEGHPETDVKVHHIWP